MGEPWKYDALRRYERWKGATKANYTSSPPRGAILPKVAWQLLRYFFAFGAPLLLFIGLQASHWLKYLLLWLDGEGPLILPRWVADAPAAAGNYLLFDMAPTCANAAVTVLLTAWLTRRAGGPKA